ncbi:hypothetical protein CK203_080771 [Vitis vinifera]|uniref:Uncharacterized protein n=1 Tax=Vitis vinifera TaxID=29760 RepID=A0A438F8C3_VITVI|nr:hypothetical protein CK203_080771 [Vitis vinifera]
MFVEIERSLRVRKFLDWGAVDTRGAAGVYGPTNGEFVGRARVYKGVVGLSLCSLSRPMSGHSPILLDKQGVRTGRTPFRFKNMWLKVWNTEVFGNVAIRKELALKQVGF